jgi:hypothetical protein
VRGGHGLQLFFQGRLLIGVVFLLILLWLFSFFFFYLLRLWGLGWRLLKRPELTGEQLFKLQRVEAALLAQEEGEVFDKQAPHRLYQGLVTQFNVSVLAENVREVRGVVDLSWQKVLCGQLLDQAVSQREIRADGIRELREFGAEEGAGAGQARMLLRRS